MLSIRRLLLPVTVSVAVGLVPGCEGCGEAPVAPQPSLTVQLSDPTPPFDGVTATQITVTAKDANQAPDASVVTATVLTQGGGFVAPTGETPSEATATVSPVEGVSVFDFRCGAAGRVQVDIESANGVKRAATLTCVVNVRNFSLDVDLVNRCSTLQADGRSSCEIQVSVTEGDDATAAAGVPVTVGVTSVANVQLLNDQLGLDPEGDLAVLSTTGTAPLVESLTATTADTGIASFFVVSPSFGLSEAVNLELTVGATTVTQVVGIDQFLDQSSVTLTASPETLSSGETTTLTVTAIAADGSPADGETVILESDANGVAFTAGEGVTIEADGSATVVLDVDGTRDIIAVAPTVTEQTLVSVSVEYDVGVDASIPPKPDDVQLTVTEPGAINVNASFDKTSIRSDVTPVESATITVDAKQGSQAFNDLTVVVTVGASSRALVRLVGDVADTGTRTINPPLTDGVATIVVQPRDSDARGIASLNVEAFNGADSVFEKTLQVLVERDPKLQSVVFLSAEPNVIGVRGSAISSSSVIEFRILDDVNEPLVGVRADFTPNDTSSGVTVVPNSISNADGKVRTVLSSGTIAGPVTVNVTVTVGDRTVVVPSEPIAIVGGLPNSSNSSLICGAFSDFDGITATCTATLVDRFTNRTDAPLNVQFRAEGGNITASSSASSGVASADFVSGTPGKGSADVRGWSYGLIVPTAADLPGFPGCFDDTVTTRCDLDALCEAGRSDPSLAPYCPLRGNVAGDVCTADISASTRDAFTDEAANPSAYAFGYFTDDATVVAQADGYTAEHRACGAPLSCLTGRAQGLSLFGDVDDCPVAIGCYDFSATTECPHEGLLSIMASVRGEEGFVDHNGNGIFDSIDTPIDMPEPFLDKNDNCAYDDLNGERRLRPIEQIRESDLFSDVNLDGTFGFGGSETNGAFDDDTEVFMNTHVLLLAGRADLEIGELVGQACGVAPVTCTGEMSNAAPDRCVESARGYTFIDGCVPSGLVNEGESSTYVFRWIDGNGNCPTPDFADSYSITAEGPVEVTEDADQYDKQDCGFVPDGAANFNGARPWCREYPSLGTPLRSITVSTKCEELIGVKDASITFSLGDRSVRFRFAVDCG